MWEVWEGLARLGGSVFFYVVLIGAESLTNRMRELYVRSCQMARARDRLATLQGDVKEQGQGVSGALAVLLFIGLTFPAMAQTFEAANGTTFKIINTYGIDNRWRGSAAPYVGALIENDDNQLVTFVFDCQGFYAVETGQHSGWHRIAPKSVLAAVSTAACRKIGVK